MAAKQPRIVKTLTITSVVGGLAVIGLLATQSPGTPSAAAATPAAVEAPTASLPQVVAAATPAPTVPSPAPVAAAPKAAAAKPKAASATRSTAAPLRSSKAAPGPAAHDSATSFRLMSPDSAGRPARWDSCTPMRWAFNPDGAPAGAQRLAEAAMGRLASVTGLQLSFTGTTTFKPLGSVETAYPAGTDAVIAFGTADEYPELNGATFGLGGFTSTATADGRRIVRGGVVLNAALLASIPDGFGPGQRRGGAILHELGHMVGLDHVDDATQVMHPSLTAAAPADYAAGDRAGLAQVGSGAGCFPTATA